MTDTVVKTPDRVHLETLAASFRELMILKGQQAATQAKIIRWAVMAITQTSAQAQRALERQTRQGNPGHYRGNVPTSMQVAKKVREDRELALLYLQWLATKLENDGIGDAPDELDIRVEAAILDAQ